MHGQEIEKIEYENQPKGIHEFIFDGFDLPAGIYFCVLKTSEGLQTRKMIKL